MEHLLRSDQAAPIVVPILCEYEYDHGPFLEYPERRGWDFSLWRQHNFFATSLDLQAWLKANQKSVSSLPGFLQSWLFFGLLENALQSPVQVQDFTRRDSVGRLLLTTAALETHLHRWNDAVHRLQVSQTAKEDHLKDLARDMTVSSTVIDTLFRIITYGNPSCRRELEEAHFCAALLLRSLAVSSERILGRHPAIFQMGQGRMPLLERRMKETGWCPYMVSGITANFFNDTQAFAFSLGTVRTKQDHRQCTHAYCIANQIGKSYKVQHIDPTCRCMLIGSPLEEILGSLRNGLIPMLSLEQAEGKSALLALSVEAHDLSSKYFAVSHLWADGLGNPSANSIPRCQLERVWSGIEDASLSLGFSGASKPVFWLDTLCIPVKPQHHVYRDLSIQKMHEIYKNAAGVLVLDSDLTFVSSTASFAEIVTRTVVSGWNSRLWTYQEATSTLELFIRAKDTSFSLNRLMNQLVSVDSWPDPFSHSLNISAAASLQSFMPKSPAKVNSNSDLEVQNMLIAIGKRITSRADDEAICIATTLGLDPSSILKCPPTQRMVKLLELLPVIPANVLFSTGKRLVQEGFRWAPESFLLPKGLVGSPIPEIVPSNWAEPSIKVRRKMFALHAQSRGLLAFLPAIRLYKFNPLTMRFVIVCDNGQSYSAGFYEHSPNLRSLEINPPSWKLWNWKSSNRQYVILLGVVFRHDRDFDLEQTGILTKVVGSITQYLARVFINREHTNGDIVQGEQIDPCWWLID